MQNKSEETTSNTTFSGLDGSASVEDQQKAALSPSASDKRPTQDPPQTPSREAESETHDGAIESFDDMGLREGLLRGIYACGFEKPSVIQQRAIVPCCNGRDVIAQAQSGTGKTATFSIAVIQQLDVSRGRRKCQVSMRFLLLSFYPCSTTRNSVNIRVS